MTDLDTYPPGGIIQPPEDKEMQKKTVTAMQCPRPSCRYTWWPVVKNPIKCPGCKNPLRKSKKVAHEK